MKLTQRMVELEGKEKTIVDTIENVLSNFNITLNDIPALLVLMNVEAHGYLIESDCPKRSIVISFTGGAKLVFCTGNMLCPYPFCYFEDSKGIMTYYNIDKNNEVLKCEEFNL